MIRTARAIAAGLALALPICGAAAKPFKALFPNASFNKPEAQKMAESFDYRQGEIGLPGVGVKLKVPAAFYFFGENDARRMLTEVWGNPPEMGNGVLGMVLPANKTPFDDAWAAVISFDEDGYVADEDAKSIDYAGLLKGMQAAAATTSEERAKSGFTPVRLLGWASQPAYDASAHKLHWAKEIEFDGRQPHTLNYNVRVLGRRGVLQMNFVARMPHLDEIERVIPAVIAMPEFQEGFRYANYVPGTDKRAAYGIGALITGTTAGEPRSFGSVLAVLAQVLVLLGLTALAGAGAWWYLRGPSRLGVLPVTEAKSA